MLLIFGGLPGTGKTTIAREVARRVHATYLRIDTIEQTLRASGALAGNVGASGYQVAYALAESNLMLGQTVIADSVNPLGITRSQWRRIADDAAVPFVEIETICSDAGEHRRRVESRVVDVPGLALPDWASVLARVYEPWTDDHTIIDTSRVSIDDAASIIIARMPIAVATPSNHQPAEQMT